MDERTVLERLSEAKVSSDLSHRHGRCDVDYVGALGAAGINHPTGSALLDADLTQSSDTLTRAYKAAEQIVKLRAARNHWLMTPQKLRRIAMDAFRLYMAPACPVCKGRGYTGVETAAEESLVDCPDCKGEGVTYHAIEGREKPVARPCETCHGKGKVTQKAKPKTYAPRPCAECGGSGKRKIPAKYSKEIRDVLAVMESRRRTAGLAVRKQMGVKAEVE